MLCIPVHYYYQRECRDISLCRELDLVSCSAEVEDVWIQLAGVGFHNVLRYIIHVCVMLTDEC